MSLAEYRKKRNFKSTPEPKGKVARRVGKARFVVQRHAASRDHYDFRLEIGGTFKSWAVPKGPSLNPLDQRLAVKVEDHPLDYGDFEGVIPKGNYGAGTVMIWDTGFFEERRAQGRKADDEKLLAGLAEGHITFVLEGTKLSGEFALVRLKKANEPNLWLLLKKRDASAVFRRFEPDDRSAVSGRTLREIAAKSEGEGAVWLPGKGRKSPAPKRKAPPLKPAPRPATAIKPDATIPRRVRAMQPVVSVRRPDGGDWIYEVDFRGHRVVAEIEKHRVHLYSRTLLSLDAKFAPLREALRAAAAPLVLDGEVVEGKNGTFRYVVSDVLFANGKDLRETPLSDRKKILEKNVGFDRRVVAARTTSDWAKAVNAARKARADHVLAKRADSTYQSGIGRDWLKLRLNAEPGSVAAEAKRRRTTPAAIVGRPDEPPLTNLSKVFWPEDGFTKGDLVAYYRSVAPIILPYLVDRPQSMHRQPDGLKNDGFFQKDNPGYVPRRMATKRIYSKHGDRTLNYVLCQDAWSLLYLANQGCIELNPWLSRVENLENPDWSVVDLDPDGNPFEEVIEAALETRKVLQAAGVDAWVKTSGATGMHLFVPTGARHDYETARKFAEAVCRRVHAKLPRYTSVERNPDRRRGKIYLDFLQNRRGQTIAAPYCVRPRPGATVSAPLDWAEVKKGLNPKAFTIRTMAGRIAKHGDRWAGIGKKSYDLEEALRRLEKI